MDEFLAPLDDEERPRAALLVVRLIAVHLRPASPRGATGEPAIGSPVAISVTASAG